MDLYNFLIIFVLFLISFLFFQNTYKKWNEPKGFPPGPRSFIPFVGGMIQAGQEPYKLFLKMRKEWGPIFAFDIGPKRIVTINDYKMLRETTSMVEFNGRSNTHAFMLRQSIEGDRHQGILFNIPNKAWSDQRRFALRNLRDFGFGKKSIESLLEVEIQDLLERFKRSKRVLIKNELQASVMGALFSILTGERREQDDPQLLGLYDRLTEDFQYIMLLWFFPWLFKIAKIFPSFLGGGILRYIKNSKFNLEFMIELVNEHKKSHEENSTRDFIDIYLNEIKNEKDPNSSFYDLEGERNLYSVLQDLFLAGAETTSTTLSWMIHLLAIYPEIQEKIYKEIKSVIGLNRTPNLADRLSLPYTEACIFEIQRYGVTVPALPHEITQDINYKGFFFPKGASILFNLYACLHDPDVWDKPEQFIPERFLSQDGTKTVKHEAFVPFFYGKRSCLGETLARDTLFLFTVSICQRFKISPDPTMKKIPTTVEYLPISTRIPISFPLIFEDRFD